MKIQNIIGVTSDGKNFIVQGVVGTALYAVPKMEVLKMILPIQDDQLHPLDDGEMAFLKYGTRTSFDNPVHPFPETIQPTPENIEEMKHFQRIADPAFTPVHEVITKTEDSDFVVLGREAKALVQGKLSTLKSKLQPKLDKIVEKAKALHLDASNDYPVLADLPDELISYEIYAALTAGEVSEFLKVFMRDNASNRAQLNSVLLSLTTDFTYVYTHNREKFKHLRVNEFTQIATLDK